MWEAISSSTPSAQMPRGMVLVFDGYNEISVAYYSHEKDQWVTPQDVVIRHPTHWMTLPVPPQTETT